MDGTARVGGANNLPGAPLDNYLTLQGVPLLFATVIGFLLFFGRSTGVSATSTTTNSISWSASWSIFLPGSLNARLFVKMSSTLRMTRQTFDSCRPQLVARWKSVRYSRQYSKVNRTWSSTVSLGGRPDLRRVLVSRLETSSTMRW